MPAQSQGMSTLVQSQIVEFIFVDLTVTIAVIARA